MYLGLLLSLALAQEPIVIEKFDKSLFADCVAAEVNRYREEAGLPPLLLEPSLNVSASSHNREMLRHQYFSHLSPIAGRETLEKRLFGVGIQGGWRGENLARISALRVKKGQRVYPPKVTGGGFRHQKDGVDLTLHTYESGAFSLVEHLMASARHRENLLHPSYRYMGLGVLIYENRDAHGMPYFQVTQHFSSRKAGE